MHPISLRLLEPLQQVCYNLLDQFRFAGQIKRARQIECKQSDRSPRKLNQFPNTILTGTGTLGAKFMGKLN